MGRKEIGKNYLKKPFHSIFTRGTKRHAILLNCFGFYFWRSETQAHNFANRILNTFHAFVQQKVPFLKSLFVVQLTMKRSMLKSDRIWHTSELIKLNKAIFSKIYMNLLHRTYSIIESLEPVPRQLFSFIRL